MKQVHINEHVRMHFFLYIGEVYKLGINKNLQVITFILQQERRENAVRKLVGRMEGYRGTMGKMGLTKED